ncbi:hypothetical protein ABZ726_27095, partial [Streptomyces hundungensis]
MTAAVRFARAAALAGCVMMLAAGCGGASGSADASDAETATSAQPSHTPAPPPDKGPPCEGSPTAKGLHVLRGGSEVLPGGAGPVLYKDARPATHGPQPKTGFSGARGTAREATTARR